jgi:hypothetical protein
MEAYKITREKKVGYKDRMALRSCPSSHTKECKVVWRDLVHEIRNRLDPNPRSAEDEGNMFTPR